MSKDETLELDVIIEESSRIGDNINIDRSDYDLDGLQTHTGVFNPQGTGQYTITVNGRELTVEVIGTNAMPDSGVARYEFEQDVTDSWGNNDGTDNTSTGYTNGIVGDYAKIFDDGGSNSVTTSLTYDTSQPFSIAYWLKLDETATQRNKNIVPIQKGTSALFYISAFRSENKIRFAENISNTTFGSGEWYFVCGTWDGSQSKLYINGSIESETTTSIDSNTESLQFSRPNLLDGAIDDTRFYNETLSPSEVLNLYNKGSIRGV